MSEKPLPQWLVRPLEIFGDEFRMDMARGQEVLSRSRVAVTGLARDCAWPLQDNLERAIDTFKVAWDWRLHIRENDSKDATKAVLGRFCSRHSWASCHCEDNGRERLENAFAGPRTVALAEYRQACADWAAEQDVDYVVVIDWDAWGGWTIEGLLSGFGRLDASPDAFGLASVSLLEHPSQTYDIATQTLKTGSQWIHYDCWALRLNCYLDDYSAGVGGWKHTWLPFVGSPLVPVCSAFGGLCIYRAADFQTGVYSGTDCEHVTFHQSIAEKTGRRLYLNPSQRTVMKWLPEDLADGQEAGGQCSPVSG